MDTIISMKRTKLHPIPSLPESHKTGDTAECQQLAGTP